MRKRTWIVLIELGLLGSGLFVLLSGELRARERAEIESDFQSIVNERVASLEREMILNIEVLFSVQSLFVGSEEVRHEEFALTVSRILDRHPDIKALEWIPRIAHAEREAAEYYRRAHFPSFQITERQEGQMVRAGQRDEYYPVYFVEPYAGNEAA